MDRLDLKRVQVVEALAGLKESARFEQLLVGQVMTPSPSCIAADTTALELVRMLHAKAFRHLLVTDEHQRLLGVISDRDVLRCFGPSNAPKKQVLEGIHAAELMSTDLITVSPRTPLSRAVVLMVDQGISCLPVLADGVLVGIITNTDLHIVLQIMLQPAPSAQHEQPARTTAHSR